MRLQDQLYPVARSRAERRALKKATEKLKRELKYLHKDNCLSFLPSIGQHSPITIIRFLDGSVEKFLTQDHDIIHSLRKLVEGFRSDDGLRSFSINSQKLEDAIALTTDYDFQTQQFCVGDDGCPKFELFGYSEENYELLREMGLFGEITSSNRLASTFNIRGWSGEELVSFIQVPLAPMFKNYCDISDAYHCYTHTLEVARDEEQADNYLYFGITKRGWLLRLQEHLRSIYSNEGHLFHRVAREIFQTKRLVTFHSHLVHIAPDFESAMGWEERAVDSQRALGNCLNQISGGFKGLHELGELGYSARSLEERERVFEQFHCEHPRKGFPNPFIAELWKNIEHHVNVIMARPKSLTYAQMRALKKFNLGQYEEAAHQVKVSVNQAKSFLANETYVEIYAYLQQKAEHGEQCKWLTKS